MADNTTTTRVVRVQVDNRDALKLMAEYNVLIDETVAKEKELRKAIKEKGGATAEDREELARLKEAQTTYKRELQTVGKEVQNNIKEQRSLEGSLVSLRAKLSNLTAEYDNLSRAEREGAAGQDLKKKINEITDELKGAEEETQRFYRNVGNYSEAFNNAIMQHIPVIGQIESAVTPLAGLLKGIKDEIRDTAVAFMEATKATTGMSVAQKAATVSCAGFSAGLKILKVALISTGIGALVVALGSLVAYFTKTQKGVEMISKAFAGFGAAVDVIIDRIAKFGGAIVKFFSGDFKGAAADMKASFAGVGEEIANETKQAVKLKEQLIEIDKEQARLNMRRSAEKVQIAELKRISDDTSKSTAERIAAAQQALDMEMKTAKEMEANGRRRIANMLGNLEMTEEVQKQIDALERGVTSVDEVIANLGLSESTFADYKALTEEVIKYNQSVEEVANTAVEGTTKLNAIRKEASDKRKAALAAELDEVRAAADAEIALMQEGIEKQIKQENEASERKIADLKRRLEEDRTLTMAARAAIEKQIELAERQHAQNLKAIDRQRLEEQIRQEQQTIELKLAAVKTGTEEEYRLQQEQLAKQMEAELMSLTLTEEQKTLIREKYRRQSEELEQEHLNTIAQKQADAVRLEWENKINEAVLQGQNTLQLQLDQRQAELDALHQLEGESDAEFKARQLEAEQAYVEAKQALADYEVQIEQAKFEAMNVIADALVGLFETIGEDSEAAAVIAKVVGIAQVAINTGVAISNIVAAATASGIGFIQRLVQISTGVATVLTNMATATKYIKSAKFSTGGYVDGPGTGTSDSIPARLSAGESVNNAVSTSMFTPIYSALNQLGGGIPIVATQSSNQIAGEEMLARAFARGVSMLDMRVGVDEIARVSRRVNVVESLGDI